MSGEDFSDESAWFLKCRAFTRRDFLESTLETSGEDVAQLDEQFNMNVARPGTSFNRNELKGKYTRNE